MKCGYCGKEILDENFGFDEDNVIYCESCASKYNILYNADDDPHEDYLNCAKCGRIDCSDLMKPWELYDASKVGQGFLCSLCWKQIENNQKEFPKVDEVLIEFVSSYPYPSFFYWEYAKCIQHPKQTAVIWVNAPKGNLFCRKCLKEQRKFFKYGMF